MTDNLFLGKKNLPIWFGVVEDNGDPLGLGRVRVRIHGIHTPDKNELPTEGLPWAVVTGATDNPIIGGIGRSLVGLQVNSRVYGVSLDGEMHQVPMVMGTLNGISVDASIAELPSGSTAQQPNLDELTGIAPCATEGACPTGYSTETSSLNVKVPNPLNIKIDRGEWVVPYTGFVSSAYGKRAGSYHCGVDICPAGYFQQTSPGAAVVKGRLRGQTGLPVFAAASGVVKYIWRADRGQRGVPTTYDINGLGSRSFGNAIAIEHNLSTGKFVTIYAHLGVSQDAAMDSPLDGVDVSVGQKVNMGDAIGTVGRTHVRDVLTHLHFEIRYGTALPASNNHINPGIVFPQMSGIHGEELSWVNAQYKYNVGVEWPVSDAPCISKESPKD